MATRATRAVPEPTKVIPDVDTFLAKIGRQAAEHSAVFENDWNKFFTMSSDAMKEAGVDTKSRKYIMDWQERFRVGRPLQDFKLHPKTHGGERKAKTYAIERNAKDRIKLDQLKKKYRKESTQSTIQRNKWAKLHRQADAKAQREQAKAN